MKLLITNAVICDTQSAFHGRKCDVTISNGRIEEIRSSSKKSIPRGFKVYDAKGSWLMPGLFDMRASLREPGFEYKEDLESAAAAAAAGGYTTITALPDTDPVLQKKADIEFIYKRAESLPVYILPYGAVTENRNGSHMNELYDMHKAGAVAFSDGNRPIMHAGVMMRALMYSRIFGGLVMSHAEDTNLSAGGRMHEGTTSVNLGLKGIPGMAEDIMVVRDIELARYTNAPVHFSHISTKNAVETIRKAKKQGVRVTCDVSVANLIYTDEALSGFDSNFKLNPPLRGKADQKALWDGIADGTIDCIVSDHRPEDAEHKTVEFEYASYGMIMLQTSLTLLMTNKPAQLDASIVIKALTANPRKVLSREQISVSTGMPAELCLYAPDQKWIYNEQKNLSKSKNSPVMGFELTGKVLATINKDKFHQY